MKEIILSAKPQGGYRIVFLMAFSASLMADMLLFMHSQMRQTAQILKEDFRILLVCDDRIKIDIEAAGEKIAAIKGTDRVVFVSKKERLERLKSEDPELVNSVLTSQANPLPDTWEVYIKEESLGDINSWVNEAWRVQGVADIKYKPLEAYAIMHALFYGHLIKLTMAMSLMVFAIIIAILAFKCTVLISLSAARLWIFSGIAGGLAATFVFYIALYPLKYLSQISAQPSLLSQIAVIICCAAFGWLLCQWKNAR